MKKLFAIVFLIIAGGSSVWGINQYGKVKLDHETMSQTQIRENMVFLMEKIKKCNEWQSQDSWYKRFMTQTRIISDESPCKGIK